MKPFLNLISPPLSLDQSPLTCVPQNHGLLLIGTLITLCGSVHFLIRLGLEGRIVCAHCTRNHQNGIT